MSESVIVLGSINTDLVIRSPALPKPGETVLGGEFYQVAGGKGANQAVAAGRAGGMPVCFLGAVGDDAFAERSLQSLAAANVRTNLIVRVADAPTGVALIMVDHHGENSISVASGANALLTADHIAAIPDEVFDNARVFLACLESPIETVAAGLARAKAHGLTTILNPAPADLRATDSAVLANVDILTPNESELALLSGRDVTTDSAAIDAARALIDRGVSTVVVTRGKAGAVVVDEESVLHVSPFEVEAVDSTAAGDVFNGVLAAGLAGGMELAESLKRATVAAAISVTRKGAQDSIPHRADVDQLIIEAQ